MKNSGHLRRNGLLLLLLSWLLTGCPGGGGGDSTSDTPAADPATVPASLTLVPETVEATGSATLTALVRAQNNAPLAGASVSFAFADNNNETLSPTTATTGEDGSVTVTVTDVGNDGGTATVRATTSGFEAQSTVIFIDPNAPGDATPVGALTVSAAATVFGTGGSTTITVRTLENDGGSIVPNAPFSASVSGGAILSNVPTTTDANGRATFNVKNDNAETVTLTVTSGSAIQTVTLYFGATLQLLTDTPRAQGEASLFVLLDDANNAPLAGQTVSFRFLGNNAETLSAASATTEESGVAEVTVTDVGNDGGTVIVQASIGDLTAQATIEFLADAGNNRTLALTASTTVLADGQNATITATVRDNFDLPLNNQDIMFSVMTPEGGSSNARISNPTPASGLTNANGQVSVVVSDNTAETVIVQARLGTATQQITLYFGASINLVPVSQEGFSDGETPAILTANVRDGEGAGIPGISVDFRVAEGSALLSGFRIITDDAGQAKTEVTNTVDEETTIIASSGNLPSAEAVIQFALSGIGFPASITIETTPASPVELSLNGTATIRATVRDISGQLVPDGVQVFFSVEGPGQITSSDFTRNGVATATYNAGTEAGQARVTVSTFLGGVSTGVSILVRPGSAGIIEVASINPEVIGIMGSGVAQTSTIRFRVEDSLGNPVTDGTQVIFSLGNTSLGGGETITTGGADGRTATASTVNGLVSVTLKSGFVAGNVDVIATVGNISTLARVSIVGGQPDADRLTIGAEFLNIAGGVQIGLEDEIRVIVSDRFGNIVADNTPVNFISEGGAIGMSVGGGGFTATTTLGQAVAILQSASPTTPNLGGVPTIRTNGWECASPFRQISNANGQSLCGNPGQNRIVAFTTGSESFIDRNANGVFDGSDEHTNPGFIDENGNNRWDQGEIITGLGDMSEPFIDGNDNGTFDNDELFIDVDNDGRFDGPDGQFQDNTTIWASMNILFSAEFTGVDFDIVSLDSSLPFALQFGEAPLRFLIVGLSDIYGNPLVPGTRVSITPSGGGVVSEPLTFTLSSTTQATSFGFTVANDEGTLDDMGMVQPPAPASLTVTVTVSSASNSTQAPGSNGGDGISRAISGQVNLQ